MAASPPSQSPLWLSHQDPPRLWPIILTISGLVHLGLFSIVYPLVVRFSQSQTSGSETIPIELIDLESDTATLSPPTEPSSVVRKAEEKAEDRSATVNRAPENSVRPPIEETTNPQSNPLETRSPTNAAAPTTATPAPSNPPYPPAFGRQNIPPPISSNPSPSSRESPSPQTNKTPFPSPDNIPAPPPSTTSPQVSAAIPSSQPGEPPFPITETPPPSQTGETPSPITAPPVSSQPRETPFPITESPSPSQPIQPPSPIAETPPPSQPTQPPSPITETPPSSQTVETRVGDGLGTLSAVIQNPRSSVRVRSSGDVTSAAAYDPARPLFTTKNFTLNHEQNACSTNISELERYLGQPIEVEVAIVPRVDETGRIFVEIPGAAPLESTPTVYGELAACLIQQWEFAPAQDHVSGNLIEDSLIIEMILYRG